MDDLVAALFCLPFLIAPLIVLIAIISNKIHARNPWRSSLNRESNDARCPAAICPSLEALSFSFREKRMTNKSARSMALER
jgi:hypothetical protein